MVEAPYNAANSMGSNLGPTSKALSTSSRPKTARRVPIDLVTTMGSGFDPHISPEAALLQVPRIAKARNLSEDQVRQLVDQHIEGRLPGVLGEPRVNVLALNMALDRVAC